MARKGREGVVRRKEEKGWRGFEKERYGEERGGGEERKRRGEGERKRRVRGER